MAELPRQGEKEMAPVEEQSKSEARLTTPSEGIREALEALESLGEADILMDLQGRWSDKLGPLPSLLEESCAYYPTPSSSIRLRCGKLFGPLVSVA